MVHLIFLLVSLDRKTVMKNIAIRENHLYKKVYLGGKKAAGRYTVIYVLKDKKAYVLKKANPSKEYINRIGLTVSKKLGGAVERNRVKRIIRAAFAQIEKEYSLKKGNLIVIAARDASVKAKSTELYEEMKKQLQRLDMIENADVRVAAEVVGNEDVSKCEDGRE